MRKKQKKKKKKKRQKDDEEGRETERDWQQHIKFFLVLFALCVFKLCTNDDDHYHR